MAWVWRTTSSAAAPPTTTSRSGARSRWRGERDPMSGAQRPQQGPRDDVALDLAGAVPDPLDARVPPEPLDGKLAHQPHAAEDLHRTVGDPSQRLGGEDLGGRSILVGHGALVELPGCLQRQELGGLELDRHVGEREAHPLEAADRLPELDPLRRPLRGHLDDPPGPADAARRHGQPARPEPLPHQVEARALLAEDLGGRDPAVGEGQLALVVAAVGDRGGPPTYGQPRRVDVDQEAGDPAPPPIRALLAP